MIVACKYHIDKICVSCDFDGPSIDLKQKSLLIQKRFPDLPISYHEQKDQTQLALGFRNKAKLAVFGNATNPMLGITTSELTQKDISGCPLYLESIQKLIPKLKPMIQKLEIPIYDIKKKSGELKYIIVIGSSHTGEHIIRFVLKTKNEINKIQNVIPEIQSKLPSIKVISANIQPIPHAIVEGPTEICLTTASHIVEKLSEYQIFLGPRCFFQTNPKVANQLYQTFQDWLKDTDSHHALDLYCGVGCFSFFAAKHLNGILGVELTSESIDCANHTKKNNRITNADFLNQDAHLFFKHTTHSFDTIVVNPPRKGIGSDLSRLINEKKDIKWLYYSSCNADTLISDFEILKERFTPRKIAVFDMFPYTKHYEVLIQFQAR